MTDAQSIWNLDSLHEDVRRRYLAAERMLSSAMEEYGCKADDLVLVHGGTAKPYTVRLKTPDEKWIDWQSANHGWSRAAETK